MKLWVKKGRDAIVVENPAGPIPSNGYRDFYKPNRVYLPYTIKNLEALGFSEEVMKRQQKLDALLSPPDYIKDLAASYPLFDKLYPYQKESLLRMLSAREAWSALRFLLADDPRLGKSVQACAILWLLRAIEHDPAPSLILCPKSLILQWKAYVEEWLPGGTPVILKGSVKERRAQIKAVPDTIYITNWETVRGGKREEFGTWSFHALIGDEAHKIKNRKSKLRKDLGRLSFRHILLLTATPIERSTADMWSLLNLLDPNRFPSYWQFAGLYCELNQTINGVEVRGSRNQEALAEFLLDTMLARDIYDVTGVPKAQMRFVPVQMTEAQQALYNKIRTEIRVMLSEEDADYLLIPNVISRLTHLRKAAIYAGIFGAEHRTVQDTEVGKLAAARDIVLSLPHDMQVIIYSPFVAALEELHLILKDAKVSSMLYTGKAAGNIEDFQSGKVKVLLATPEKGGVGLNLFVAGTIIWLGPVWSSIVWRQANARIMHPKKTDPVQILQLYASGTIERTIYDLVHQKGLTQKEISARILDMIKREEK